MLSNTKGYQRFSRTLGYHSDDLSKLVKVCRHWRDTGKCKAFKKEQEVRREIGAAKEAELLKKATALYTMQMELMEGMADADKVDAEASGMAHGSFSADPAKRQEVIGKIVEELKQEPAYLNWSLDAAVAERLVALQVKPCLYSHRADLNGALKRSRGEREQEVTRLHEEAQGGDEVPRGSSTHSAAMASSPPTANAVMVDGGKYTNKDNDSEWAAERRRIFDTLTPLQRCVVCLLWQRTFRVAQGVMMDVRLALDKRVRMQYETTGRVGPPSISNGCAAGLSLPYPSNSASKNDAENADTEDALETYLSSAAFEELVDQETKRVVPHVAFRPEFGLVDLSALPQLVAHMSTHPTCGVILARTLTYFTGKTLQLPGAPSPATKSRLSRHKRDDAPSPASFQHLLFPGRKHITEKELDLSTSARANEVIEAIEWALEVYHRDAHQNTHTETVEKCDEREMVCKEDQLNNIQSTSAGYVTALFRNQRVRLHGLTLARCQITSADGIVESLHKRHMEEYLYALDLSENRLWSLRFLLVLRAHYARRLLRLSLRNNPITRKPEYQEQVRTSLPQLTSLDGEPIRRPPLRLPKPWPTSCTRWSAEEGTPEYQEQEAVLECVARLLYIWETRRIPHSEKELAAFRAAGNPAPVEEDLNEDNFAHRYLHPAAVFSVTMSPGLSFFDADTMRDARGVEIDGAYAGMRLGAVDVRDARVFNVAMKNSSRNLLSGRPALQRYGRGAENCYAAYQLTLYPERMNVSHHLTGAVVSVAYLPNGGGSKASASVAASTATADKPKKKCSVDSSVTTSARFGALTQRNQASHMHVVTLHGIMTWQLPSMKGNECLQASYTRILVFTKKILPSQNREWERLRSPPYVLVNDQVFLFPTPTADGVVRDTALFLPSIPSVLAGNTVTRLSRLVVEFGLEACRDGVALVRDVMERCTSLASEYAALQALVLGVLGTCGVTDDAEAEAELACAQASEKQLTSVFADYLHRTPPPATAQSREYVIFSVLNGGISLGGPTTATTTTATAKVLTGQATPLTTKHQRLEASSGKTCTSPVTTAPHPAQIKASGGTVDALAWASTLHVVTLSLLHHVTEITNASYTLSLH